MKTSICDCEIIDDDFDDTDDFSVAVLDNIRRCGTVDIHPNAWGQHDYIGVNTSKPIPEYNFPTDKRKPRKEYVQRRYEPQTSEKPRKLTAIEQRDIDEKFRFDWAFSQLCGFPHCTSNIAGEVAVEFAQFGHVNAEERGMTAELWIWKRSRFMAGFR